MSVILSLCISNSMVAISFSKSSTLLKSIISTNITTSQHIKRVPLIHSHIKLAAGYSAAHIHIATNGHNSINSIHSSYEQVDFVVNECWVYCHGDILLQCCSS